MKKLLTLLAVSALICSCNSEKEREEDNRTIITGQIVNFTAEHPQVVQWNLCDPFNDDRISTQLSEDGKFKMESDGINLFHDMTIRYDDFIAFLAAPGDSIHIKIDLAKIKEGASDGVVFSGDRADDNNKLSDYLNTASIVGSDFNNEINTNLDLKSMITDINRRLDMYKETLNAYDKRQKTPMSDDLRDFIERDMIFTLANRVSDYRYDNPKEALELFGNPLFGINDSLNLCTMYFPYHLGAYYGTKIFSDVEVQAAQEQNNYSEVTKNIIRILKKEPTSFNRDVVMWQFLSNMIIERPKLSDSIPEINTIFSNQDIAEKFSKLIQKQNKKVQIADTPIKGISYMEADGAVNELPNGDMFQYLTQKYPNKVLYIDVYATWCGPCRVEMKDNVPALHDAMKGKDVEFVNLCLSSGFDAWEEMVKEFNLTNNYWFNDDATKMFMSVYKIDGFPTYILVGKDGKISTLSAARPSSLSRITEQINELLKN